MGAFVFLMNNYESGVLVMPSDSSGRFAGIRRRVLVMVAVVFVVPMAVFASASPAMASSVFEKFQGCPTEIPIVEQCAYGVTTGGEVAIKTTKVPINKPIIQQTGQVLTGNPEQPTEYVNIGAKPGFEAFQKVALNVPGGLLGFVNCTEITGEGFFEKAARESCKAVFEHGVTEVTATTESVANAANPPLLNERNLTEESGIAVTLPVRIHLKNSLLGNGCYIGSEASPIELHLSTGASGKLHGKKGTASTLKEVKEGKTLRALHIAGNSLVDNTFTVPVAEGCGEFLGIKGFLDSIVDGKIGLPSTAGNNSAVLNGELNSTSAQTVIESGF